MSLFKRTEDPMAQLKSELAHADLSQRRDIADRESEVTTQFQLNTRNDRNDITKWQQDLDPKFEEFMHHLFGEMKIGGKYVKVREQLVSTDCIYDIYSLLKVTVNQNMMMTWLEKNEINAAGLLACQSLQSDILTEETVKYDTPTPVLSDIMVRFTIIIKMTMNRALAGRERKSQTEIRQVKEVHTDNPNEKKDNKKGWLF